MKEEILFYLERGNNGIDFGVSGAIQELSHEKYMEVRNMLVVAIGTMEEMWRKEQERKMFSTQIVLKDHNPQH